MNNTIFCAALSMMMTLALGCSELDDATTRDARTALNDGQTACLIDFLNAPQTSLETLDQDARLDRRAAESLMSLRAGDDGRRNTSDDNHFTNRAQIETAGWMGAAQLEKLDAYAASWCQKRPAHSIAGSFDGVVFTYGEARAVLQMVNNVPADALEHVLDFNPEASARILELRPFGYLLDLSVVDAVGGSELQMLKSAAALR